MLLRTPNARDGEPRGTQPPEKRLEGGHQPSLGDQVEHLLPTPIAAEGTKPSNTMGVARRAATGEVFLTNVIVSLEGMDPTEVLQMLPTPSVADSEGGHATRSGARSSERLLPGVAKYELLPTTTSKDAQASGSAGYGGNKFCTLTDAAVRQPSRWGKYAAAIARWEAVTRPAPEPTNITEGYLRERAKRLAWKHKKPVGMRGSLRPRRQLAAAFSEWMMGVPLGWITDVPGITRNEALKAAGNGVVPQQAAEALRFLLDMPTGRDIAAAQQPVDLFEAFA